ncbi:MAG TPA: RnfH family protein [Pseudomonadales bacterium]|nr:RnfH family protein [Pseudomonadales bacterium]
MPVEASRIRVEVVYGTRDEQALIAVEVAEGSTILEAIDASGILERYPAIERENFSVGVFGKIAQPGQTLQAGDRVEIYRPLLVDPVDARRQRAKKGVRT